MRLPKPALKARLPKLIEEVGLSRKPTSVSCLQV